MSFSMSSIKITLNQADGSQQTFVRSVEKGGGDGTAASALASLRTHMGDVQSELNAALTVLVDKEKAASATSGKVQDTKRSGNCLDPVHSRAIQTTALPQAWRQWCCLPSKVHFVVFGTWPRLPAGRGEKGAAVGVGWDDGRALGS